MAEEAETVNKQQTRTRKSWSPVNSEAGVGWDWGRNDTNYCKNLEPRSLLAMARGEESLGGRCPQAVSSSAHPGRGGCSCEFRHPVVNP